MRAQIDSARIVTKEMKAQMRKDKKMAKRTEAAAQKQAAEEAMKAESEGKPRKTTTRIKTPNKR